MSALPGRLCLMLGWSLLCKKELFERGWGGGIVVVSVFLMGCCNYCGGEGLFFMFCFVLRFVLVLFG